MDTIISIIIGALCSIGGTIFINWRSKKNESKNLLTALKAEIEASIIIASKRKYLEGLKNFIQAYSNSQKNGENIEASFVVQKTDIHNIIFRNNADKIGLIKRTNSTKIIQFHMIVESLFIDFAPDSFQNKTGITIDNLIEDLRLLARAIKLGQKLINKTIIEEKLLDECVNYSSD